MMRRTLARARRLRELQQRIGTLATARHVWRRLTERARLTPVDVVGFYRFVTQPPFGAPLPADMKRKTIAWFIPDFDVGSGGHLNIFRLAWHLEDLGYECRIVIVGPCRYPSAQAARDVLRRHFFPLAAEVWLGADTIPPSYFSVATSWITAYYVRAFQGAAQRIYFVQDFEPFFFPAGSEYLFAENTYRFGFYGITAGEWLAGKLAADYGMRTRAIGFAVELDRYSPRLRRDPEIRRVFFYARPPTLRRAFEFGLLVLAEVARRLPDVKFVLAGWDVGHYVIPFAHLNAGNVALAELPDLYSQCDVALVLSCTNLSLLPLELMACGCPVVSNRGSHVEWLLNPDIAVLADFTVEALSEAVIALLADDARRRLLVDRGIEYARRADWRKQAERFAAALEDSVSQGIPTGDTPIAPGCRARPAQQPAGLDRPHTPPRANTADNP